MSDPTPMAAATPWPRPISPVLNFAPELLLAAQGVRAAIFDVDGCLTDGRIYIGEHGESVKAFSTLDGHGIKLLARAGIVPCVISGRDSAPLRLRLQALGVQHLRLGTEDKRPAAEALLAELGLDWSQAAAMGDDWPDLPLLRRAAFACAPPQAHAEARALATHITTARAGEGAARELCDLLLVAGGHYRRLLDAHAGAAE